MASVRDLGFRRKTVCNFLVVPGSINIVPPALKLMLTILIATSVMALLYGMAWHNQPARQPAFVRPVRKKGGRHHPSDSV
jgi:hypothetical protein